MLSLFRQAEYNSSFHAGESPCEVNPMKTLICILLMTLALGELNGQQATQTHSAAANGAAGKCHRMLTGFADKDSTFFSTWEGTKASETLGEIETCARESYNQLTKYDLAVAVVVTGWLTAKIRDDLIQVVSGENRELQSKLDQLTKANSSTSTSEMQLTSETLPSGYTKTLNIGGNQDRCTADGPESMKCEKFVPNLGYWPDSQLTAMLARVKTSYGSTSYLIGCPPSANCAPLVPGEYPATMSGSDGLVISGLVTEGKTEDSPRHGIYTILSRY